MKRITSFSKNLGQVSSRQVRPVLSTAATLLRESKALRKPDESAYTKARVTTVFSGSKFFEFL